ncbi:sulfate/molybdate ABC transporter ATP-binding protein [Labedella phragmitis]|uniref:sulfate/molybdate ABC transporter ATP-binding protein n=1 Tax=Labedella phragmitis TaxID=2498849 RepID=UPI00140A465A|nr:ATP-binding cassette domain-containing protein [Labedella phragmitis]
MSATSGERRGAGDLDVHVSLRRGSFALDAAFLALAGRTLAIAGPNGAGKTTVLECIAGVTVADTVGVRVGERVLDDVGTHVPPEARRVGMVFQEYLLFPHLTVLDNVAFGPRSTGAGRLEARERAAEWLHRFGLSGLSDRRPHRLSGGQRQRVALARALVTEPDVLLLDEPLAALDVEVRDDVRLELADHLADFGGATIVVTHDAADIRTLADDLVILERGAVTHDGPVAAVFDGPTTAYARRLVGRAGA